MLRPVKDHEVGLSPQGRRIPVVEIEIEGGIGSDESQGAGKGYPGPDETAHDAVEVSLLIKVPGRKIIRAKGEPAEVFAGL